MNNSDSALSESDQHKVAESEVPIEREMTFLEPLQALRWTVFRSFVAFIIGASVIACLLPNVGSFLQQPLQQAYAANGLEYASLVSYKPMGVFSVFIQIVLLGGLILSMPFVLYFAACFIAPGLTEQERQIVRPACFAAFVLFLAGVAAAFYLILPLTLTVSVHFNQMMGQTLFLAASEYYNTVVWFSLTTGAIFQFPLVIVILVFIQVLTIVQLKAVRRAVFVGMMVFAALLTPGGDFISLLLTTSILYGLYELAIIVSTVVEKKRRETEFANWDEAG